MSVERMIREAEKSLGLGEPNHIHRWYSSKVNTAGWGSNWAWCNAAVTYWAWMSGNQKAVTFSGYYAYTVAHASAFQQRGQWHRDVAGIRRGDIVFFDWAGSDNIGAIDHVGIVTGVSGTKVLTIEGNTENVCARRVRTAREIAGYGRPKYTSQSAPPAQKPMPQYEPFPGAAWFTLGRRSPIVARMHDRLVAVGCNRYETSTNKDVIGSGDVASYEAWQRKCGYTGADAKWPPGKTTWDRLKVPRK